MRLNPTLPARHHASYWLGYPGSSARMWSKMGMPQLSVEVIRPEDFAFALLTSSPFLMRGAPCKQIGNFRARTFFVW